MLWADAVPDLSHGVLQASILLGFVLWTFTVMSGAMWAGHAWGRFWGGDPKEVWSFVIWIIYAAYLHSRTTQGWAGRRAALLAISWSSRSS